MDWINYSVTIIIMLLVFLLTGAPVTPHQAGKKFNKYNERDTTYFFWLAWHYWLGAMFVAQTIVGAFRTLWFTNDGKQVAMVWHYSFLIAGVFCIIGSYTLQPSAEPVKIKDEIPNKVVPQEQLVSNEPSIKGL